MERIKNMSLKRAFLTLTLCFLVVALILSGITFAGCIALRRNYESDNIMVEIGDTATVQQAETENALPWQARALDTVQIALPVLLIIGALVAADVVFYRIKLKGPLRQLEDGSLRIRDGDLDFRMNSQSEDELGRLTGAFDEMRGALLQSNREMWRQAEERKRLNAAFSHDLRNPITVLKGQLNLMGKRVGADAGQQESLAMMGQYLSRVEGYVDAMSRAGRLEELPFAPQAHDFEKLTSGLQTACVHLADGTGKETRFRATGAGMVKVDSSILFNVAENLFANALRYACHCAELVLEIQTGKICLTVQDDGPGFPEHILREGTKPFLRGNGQEADSHFGMGLYICRLMCEKHGGSLRLANTEHGAKAVAILFLDDRSI